MNEMKPRCPPPLRVNENSFCATTSHQKKWKNKRKFRICGVQPSPIYYSRYPAGVTNNFVAVLLKVGWVFWSEVPVTRKVVTREVLPGTLIVIPLELTSSFDDAVPQFRRYTDRTITWPMVSVRVNTRILQRKIHVLHLRKPYPAR